MLAHAYDDVNEFARGLRTWEAAIRGAPEAGNLHNEYGYALLHADRFDEAVREFEEYRRLNPREPNPYDRLAEARLTLGEPERALEAYDTALTIDPQFFESYGGRAWAFAMRGRYDEALADADRYASSLKTRKAPAAAAGLLLSRVGRYRDAAASIERGRAEAVRFSDRDGQVDADLLTGLVALERGQFEAARAAADRALTLVPPLRDRVRGRAPVALQFVAGVAEARAGAMDAARRRIAAGGADAPGASPIEPGGSARSKPRSRCRPAPPTRRRPSCRLSRARRCRSRWGTAL